MILVLLSWSYILFSAINFGVLFHRIFKIPISNLPVTFFCGIFATTIFAGFWAIFYRLHWEFHLALLIINLLLCYFLRVSIRQQYFDCVNSLKLMPSNYKVLLAFIVLLVLAKCSLNSIVVDNESYYLQTIKWLNEYGYVKGVANVHLFLMQQSGLHLTQAAFNFSFLYKSFNDVNGLLLVMANLFGILKLSNLQQSPFQHSYIIGLLPLANLLLLEFSAAPSPDLPIYILTFFIIYYFIESYQSVANHHIIVATLCLFAIIIKPSAIMLALFPIILLFKTNFRSQVGRLVALTAVVAALYLTKNFITSGYPLFPILWNPFDVNFAVPLELAKLYYRETKIEGFNVGKTAYESLSILKDIQTWAMMPKLNGVFNKIALLLLFAVPILLKWKLNFRVWWLIYFVMTIQFLLLASISPQYRFFLNFILFFGIVASSFLLIKFKLVNVALYSTTAIAGLILFINVDISSITNNTFNTNKSVFSVKNIFVPNANSTYENSFTKKTEPNFEYYSPENMRFLYGTGDGPLPCVNEKQINYFKRKFNVIPQPFSQNLDDGFYSMQLPEEP